MPAGSVEGRQVISRARVAGALMAAGLVLVVAGVAVGQLSGAFGVIHALKAEHRIRPPIAPASSADARLTLVKVVTGHLEPKSVIASGTMFFVQNMMYLHSVNVYDSDLQLVKIIPDSVDLASMGYKEFPGTYRGAPVEAAIAPDRKHVYVSNYSMYGPKPFGIEGKDVCTLADRLPNSFVYRIDVASLKVDQAIEVGAVPKFLTLTPNGKLLLVSNWCSFSVSVIDVALGRELMQIPLGAYPRGIAVDPAGREAYVAVMGSTQIAAIDLRDFRVSWITGVGTSPRHLVISPDGRWLYATIDGDGVVDKIDLTSRTVVNRVATGKAPRSMTIASDGGSLYVVNYKSNTVTKLRTSDMHVLQVTKTDEAPIGIAYDAPTHRVVVACYSGSIMVFSDRVAVNK